MREVAIIGAGIHKFGRFPNETYIEIGQAAVRDALRDAGISWKDIQTAVVSEQYLPSTTGPRILKPFGATGIPIMDMESACASGGSTLRQAILAKPRWHGELSYRERSRAGRNMNQIGG